MAWPQRSLQHFWKPTRLTYIRVVWRKSMRRLKLRKQYNKVKLLLYSCFYFLYIKPLPAFLLCIVKLYRKVFDGIEFIAPTSSMATCFVMRHNLSYIYYIIFFELLDNKYVNLLMLRYMLYVKLYSIMNYFVDCISSS